VTAGSESSNWTRDASNPETLQSDPLTGRGTHPIQLFRNHIHIGNMLFIRVNPSDPHNPCDYSFVGCTHRLKTVLLPAEASVTGDQVEIPLSACFTKSTKSC
jgi:hypothetical protein